MELGGYLLPAGTIVIASIIGAHLFDTFPHADEFQPERFLGQPPPPYALPTPDWSAARVRVDR